MRKRSQAELVPLLKVYIDAAMSDERSKFARGRITHILTGQNIGTRYVMHNIGKKRYKWLVEFLQEQ